jgi:DeoR family transcriptional regulator, fructose operon transcriptional repressor
MYAEERQLATLARAREHGRVEVGALAGAFGVTPETVRRDLAVLERRGVLRRVHGGAIPIERFGFEPAVATRDLLLTDEKVRIARAALDELPDGEGAIFLDAGTTTKRLAELLPLDRSLMVVTNAVNLLETLCGLPNLTILVLGGRLRARTLATVDAWALDALTRSYVDVAFLATNGFSLERGLTTSDASEAAVKRAVIASARRTVLLADHTKVGNDHFQRFAEASDVDTFITDSGLDAGLAREIEDAGIKVRLA